MEKNNKITSSNYKSNVGDFSASDLYLVPHFYTSSPVRWKNCLIADSSELNKTVAMSLM